MKINNDKKISFTKLQPFYDKYYSLLKNKNYMTLIVDQTLIDLQIINNIKNNNNESINQIINILNVTSSNNLL